MDLKIIFNIQKFALQGALFGAYLHECGGQKIIYFLMPFTWNMTY